MFYDCPYTFGMLFGLGLYAIYKEDPETFKTNYDDLLASTGLANAATLANRFGIDITQQTSGVPASTSFAGRPTCSRE